VKKKAEGKKKSGKLSETLFLFSFKAKKKENLC